MKVFDFHLHPGYDFHGPALDYATFTGGLKQDGIVKCAGSFAGKCCRDLPMEEYARLLPEFNRKIWEFQEVDPDFFVPGIHIHPDHVEMSLEEIRKHHEKGGVLIGELIHYMMGWNYSHKNLYPLLSYIRDLDMVVSMHPTADFATLEKIMENIPGLKLVLAHLSGYGLYDRTLEFMRKYETVYTDLSAHGTDFDGTVANTVNQIGSDRILYGSDYPGYKTRPFIDIVLNARIREAEKENILYNNAAALLRTL